MSGELVLRTGAYSTTAIGLEVLRKSTKKEWQTYGEILRRVEEAKQWAIGDWLVDGKRHYGDGLYEEAAKVLGLEARYLEDLKRMSGLFEITYRYVDLSWKHHREVASLRPTIVIEKGRNKGKWALGDEPDYDKMAEFLDLAVKKKWSTRDLAEQVKLYKQQQLLEIELANKPDSYKVIYADPPWWYDDKCEEGAIQSGGCETHYSCMTIDELCKLPVKELAMDNSALFLWVTSPLLEECFDVIKAWGFEYKASFIWDKVGHNMGHYNSVRHELLLICTRGSCVPECDTLLDSVVSIKKTSKHSEKPDEFRKIIEEMYPNARRIELFARTAVDGWDRWGLEADEAS